MYSTHRKESLKTRAFRTLMNYFPSYFGTGGKMTFVSADWYEMHIAISLNLRTRNYVGTVFGGSIYAALDPVYMIQLMNILGENYVVWDKAAAIKFIKPIKTKVYARFLITDELLETIKTAVKTHQKYIIDLPVYFEDKAGVKYAEINKTIYIADKAYYQASRK